MVLGVMMLSGMMLGGIMLGGMTPVGAQPRTTPPSDLRLRVLPLGKRIAGNGEAGAMNPVEKALRKVDATQQRFTPPAFVFGVVKKYGDDNGGVLVSNMAYSAFVSLFPLLLILVTVLGLIAAADPSFRESAVKNAVADQIPLLGQTLTSNVSTLQRSSTIGLIVGLLVLIYGVTGLAQAGLFTMEQVWNLPGPARPGYVQRLGRAVLFLCLLGGGVIVTTGLAWLSTYLQGRGLLFKLLLDVVTAAFGTGMFIGAFRALTPKGVPTRSLLPGSVTGGILWTVLQVLGAWLVHHFLHSNSVYGIFATVLGLLAWIYLAVEITVYCAEINVVLNRRLWPRSIVQPPLTEADRASMALQALQNQRRPEQHVEVTFDDRPPDAAVPAGTPQTPDEVTPPGPPDVAEPRDEPDPSTAGDRA
jgi:YihY family inner membrane protein